MKSLLKTFGVLFAASGLVIGLAGCQKNENKSGRAIRAGAASYGGVAGSGVNIVPDSKVSGDPQGNYQGDVMQLASGSIAPTDLGSVDDSPSPDPLGVWLGLRLCLGNYPSNQVFTLANSQILVKIWDSYAQAAQASGQNTDMSIPIYMTNAKAIVQNGLLAVQFWDGYGSLTISNISLTGGGYATFVFDTTKNYDGSANPNGPITLGTFALSANALGCN